MLLKSKEIAFLGVLLGLNQLFIILSSIIETNTLILMGAAALTVGIIIVESGARSGIVFYAASCILGFFLTFNKTELITYILFFGMYSIVKHLTETRISNKYMRLAAKLVYFNISAVMIYFAAKMFIPLEIKWWMIFAVQPLFFIYDYAFTVFINYYMLSIRPKIKK